MLYKHTDVSQSITMNIQTIYQQTIKFAASKHAEKNQKVPGTNLPYVVHISNVAMEIFVAYQNTPEFNLELAIKLALLHDTLEDTSATFEEISKEFGYEVAEGVLALTKNEDMPKSERMVDSLFRIKKLSKEVRAVKLADRITNLQVPPKYWSNEKKQNYLQEAIIIMDTLKGENQFLENRLEIKIKEYESYID